MPIVRVTLRHPRNSSPVTGEAVTVRYQTVAFDASSAVITKTSKLNTNASGFADFDVPVSALLDPVGLPFSVSWAGLSGSITATMPATTPPHHDGTLNVDYWLLPEIADPGQLTDVELVVGVQSVTGTGVDNTDPRNPVVGGGSGAVSSVFTRTGAVVAASGDYAAFYDTAGAAAAAQSAASTDATTKANAAQAAAISAAATDATTKVGAEATTRATADTTNATAISTETTRATTAEALLAPKANPALTGVPTVPTAAPGTNNTQAASTAYADAAAAAAAVGLLDYRGTYNASVNTFPASGGSGSAGALLKGDFWIVSTPGTLGGTAVTNGDLVIALTDAPGQTAANWDLIEHDVGYAPENVANKSTDGTLAANSTTLYPSQSAVKTYADGKVVDAINDAVTTSAPSQNAVFDALALKAPLASPTFTGTPAAPTPSQADNSTKLATTAYVDTATAAALTAARAAVGVAIVLGA